MNDDLRAELDAMRQRFATAPYLARMQLAPHVEPLYELLEKIINRMEHYENGDS